MRLIFFIALLCFGLASQTQAQDTEFPYNAIVLNDGAEVHSGPGDSLYATNKLDANELVRVFRHDPGGWCAIRPPAKSFSLIPERAVKMLGDDVGEIVVDGIEAYVGTTVGPVDKPLRQVRLKKGDRVVILGRTSWPHSSGKSNVWYQIEPPAGEFRWIRMSDLQLPPAEDAATQVDYSEPPVIETRSQARVLTQTQNRTPIRTAKTKPAKKPAFKSETVTKSSSVGWKASTRPIPAKQQKRTQYSGTFGSTVSDRDRDIASRDDGFVEQATFLNQEPSDPRFESWDGNTIPGITDVPRPTRQAERFASLDSMEKQTRTSRSFVREQPERLSSEVPRAPVLSPGRSTATQAAARDNSTLIQIEDKLSAEMLKDPQSWNLTEIKFATERAKAVSSDAVERLALQHILDKIAKCDQLRKGYQQASPFPNSSVAATAGVGAGADRIYDATGLLKRLASSSGSMNPVYVLQDSLGNVTHEIAGSAGMNLGQYVDKRVGVIGRRGFNQRLRLQHVTVDRVVVFR